MIYHKSTKILGLVVLLACLAVVGYVVVKQKSNADTPIATKGYGYSCSGRWGYGYSCTQPHDISVSGFTIVPNPINPSKCVNSTTSTLPCTYVTVTYTVTNKSNNSESISSSVIAAGKVIGNTQTFSLPAYGKKQITFSVNVAKTTPPKIYDVKASASIQPIYSNTGAVSYIYDAVPADNQQTTKFQVQQ